MAVRTGVLGSILKSLFDPMRSKGGRRAGAATITVGGFQPLAARFVYGATAGTVLTTTQNVGRFVNAPFLIDFLEPGATLSISPNDGRLAFDTFGRLIVGTTATAASTTTNYTITKALPGLALVSTTIAVTSGPAPPSTVFAFETEASALFTAMDAVGNSALTVRRKLSINRKIKRLKAAGLWNSVVTWYSDAGLAQNEAQWLINWINPSQKMTKVGSPVFTLGSGVSTTSASGYYDTGVALNSFNQNSAHIGVYSNTGGGGTSTAVDAGAQDGSGNGLEIVCESYSTNFMAARVMGALVYTTGASAGCFNGGGHNMAVRNSSSSIAACHRGPIQETMASASQAITSTATMSVLVAKGNSSFSIRSLRGYHHGAGMTQDQSDLLGAILSEWSVMIPWGEPTIIPAGLDLSAILPTGVGGPTVTVDVAVYGTTMAAIITAWAIKRFNSSLRVAIFAEEDVSSPWRLGGMLAQGLDFADVQYTTPSGNKYISGIFRDIIAWKNTVYASASDPHPPTQASVSDEPRTWNAAARRMLDPTKTGSLIPGLDIPVYFSTGLSAVQRNASGRITGFTCGDGRQVTCSFLADQDYLGIAVQLAGLPYTTGREAAGAGVMESQNGYQLPSSVPKFGTTAAGGTGTVPIRSDPYVTTGVPASGLLPDLVTPPALATGQPDASLQSINFRLCFTKDVSRRAPLNRVVPAGYSAARYERFGRAMADSIALGTIPTFFDIFDNQSEIGSEWDFNSGGSGYGTDLPSSGVTRAQAVTPALRAAGVTDLYGYTWGLLNWLQTSGDSRIPTVITSALANYYLDAFQWTDPDSSVASALWRPSQPYDREAIFQLCNAGARLNGDDCAATDGTTPRISPHIIGCCSYAFDYHPVRQVAFFDGTSTVIYNQGRGFTGASGGSDAVTPLPMEIFWPDQSVCGNYATSTHPSMTKVAFSTYRLEPSMCVLAESVGLAIAIAVSNGTDIQAVPYSSITAAIAAAPDSRPVYLQTIN